MVKRNRQKPSKLSVQPATVGAPTTFAEVLAPIPPETFFAEYYNRKPLHIPGAADKFSSVMNWSVLNNLLDMTAIWESSSLMLVLDGEVLPAGAYCTPAASRDGASVQQPDAAKVMSLMRRGASLVANDIDTLTPELRQIANAMEDGFQGKAQSNLYCSWRQRQAFRSHFDTHDVFALHFEGEKVWRIYENREPNPIRHPKFTAMTPGENEQRKGELMKDVRLTPGDVLYIPRGWYHDALAASDATIHLAFGLTGVIGLDVLAALSDAVVTDEMFRLNLPHACSDPDGFKAHIAYLGQRLQEICEADDFVDACASFQAKFRYPRGGFDLPIEVGDKRYKSMGEGLKIVHSNDRHLLTGPRGAAPIPSGLEGPVAWVIERHVFTRGDLLDAHPKLAVTELDRLIGQLQSMAVIKPTDD